MIGGGVDIGRLKDATVLVFAEQETWEEPIIIRLIRVMERTPFEVQRATLRAYFERYNPDLVCIDSSPIGMDISERLQMEMPAVIRPISFTEADKSNLMGNAYDYFTSEKVRIPRKYRAVQEEFSNIRKEVTPAGRVVYRDEPHGDVAWAASLAFYAIKLGGGQGFAKVNTANLEDSFQEGQNLRMQMAIRPDFRWQRIRKCQIESCDNPTRIQSVFTGKSYCSIEHRDKDYQGSG